MIGTRASRLDNLLAHRPAQGLAVEVAPYFNPALPKAQGNDVLILDVFDTGTLRRQAAQDPNVPDHRITEIEEVDIVGDASSIGDLITARGLAGRIGFVVSSHNFEHLPDPIRFLQGIEQCLAPGGILSMAIPDCRATFDHFRGITQLIDWLVAYHDGHKQPTADAIFDHSANMAVFGAGTDRSIVFDWRTKDPQDARLLGDVKAAYRDWLAVRGTVRDYQDCHVSVIFDAQFALMIEDLRHLGLTGLEVIEITPNHGHEFFVHLRKPVTPAAPTAQDDYRARREVLLRRVAMGLGDLASPFHVQGLHRLPLAKRLARGVIGRDVYQRIKLWNRARRTGRKD